MKFKIEAIRYFLLTFLVTLIELDSKAQAITSFKTISGDGIYIEAYEKDIYNNAYIAGGTYGSSNFIYDTTNFAIGYSNLFICKLDSLGLLVWINFYPVSEFSKLFDITIDSIGNIYTCGTFHGNLILDSANVFSSLSNSQDGILLKLDSSGGVIWSRASYSIGNSGFSNPIIKNNDLYINIQYSPEVYFDTLYFVGDQVYQNAVIFKLDTSGNIQTSKNMTCGTINGFKQGTSQNLYVTGTTYTSMTIDSMQFPILGPGWSNIYLMKLDSNLQLLNHRTVTYPLIQYYWNSQPRFAIDENENIYLGGYFDSPSVIGDSILNTASNLGDIFLAEFDSSFNYKWSRKYGGVEQDLLLDLKMTQNGKLILCTGFNDSTVFDGFNLSSLHGGTMLLSCIDSTGNVLWTKFNQEGYCGPIAKIIELANNNISLLGSFSDSLLWDTYNESNGGYFILEIEDITASNKEFVILEDDIVIYPNPSKGLITFSKHNNQIEQLNLYDVSGKEILSKKILNSIDTVVLDYLQNGIYIILFFDKEMKLISRKRIVLCKI